MAVGDGGLQSDITLKRYARLLQASELAARNAKTEKGFGHIRAEL
jgi:hypothetical protein